MIILKSGPREARVEEGLRLSAAMLGMDEPPGMVFLDNGVECLLSRAFNDPVTLEYLRVAADLAGVHALSESLGERGITTEELDPVLRVELLDVDDLAEMTKEYRSVVAF
ncbi:MAG: DsrE family protein [Candidatus Bathyarchaeota archaeon]|nr:MAG: DsrE family protein [Candidatus Bathyarchaeota archaeon]